MIGLSRRNIMGALIGLLSLSAACDRADPAASKVTRELTAYFDRPTVLAAARRSVVPAPIVVMMVSDPWASVIGADSPSFALYEDGTAIYSTDGGFRSIKLPEADMRTFLAEIDVGRLPRETGVYASSNITDQATKTLLIYRGDHPIVIQVYGDSPTSGLITNAMEKLSSFKRADARAWMPSKIEVMIWPYAYAPDPSVIWPMGWPGLDSPETQKRGDDSYSIFLPSAQLSELTALLNRRTEKAAIEIGSKKWAASVRFPFPHENLWM